MVEAAWKETEGKWYYLKENGAMAHGELCAVGDEIYCFAEDGRMLEGEVTLHTNERGALVV